MRNCKSLFAALLASLMLLSLVTVSAAGAVQQDVHAYSSVAGFTDVDSEDYFADAVQWAVDNGVTNGTSPTTFSPLNTVVRADAVTFLWRASGSPEPAAASSPFTDVTDPDAYYYNAVLWAAEEEITNGVTADTFGLRGTLTYEQILTLLCRTAGGDAYGADWSALALAWGQENGLTDGLAFSPAGSCPRADMVYFLWKQLGQEDPGQETPPAEDPEEPAEEPDTPTEEPTPPAEEPETPAEEPETPAEEPEEPTEEPEEPAQEPEEPAVQAPTEQEVYNIIIALKADYPEGMPWTNDNRYYSPAMHMTGYGCAGFALICSDAAFGDLPGRTHYSFDDIRVGDMIRIGDYHSVVVLEKKDNSVIVTEGNYNSSIHWGREITRASLEKTGFYVQTRYPV